MFEVITDGCNPTRGSKYSSCVDLYSAEDVVIGAGETKVVGLGVKIDLENLLDDLYGVDEDYINYHENRDFFMQSHCLELKCRSSLPLKKGLIIANGVGEIDLDYPDEIGIILHNPLRAFKLSECVDIKTETFLGGDISIKKGDKIAQIKLVEHKSYLFGIESDEVRDGGFGSTDKKDDLYISSMLDDVNLSKSWDDVKSDPIGDMEKTCTRLIK